MRYHATDGLHESERGAVMVEAALVLLAIMMFLLISPAVWRIWMTEHHARSESQREMFAWTVSARYGQTQTQPAWGPTPEAAPLPARYSGLPNTTDEGWHEREVKFTGGLTEFLGQIDIARKGYVIRPSHVWSYFPISTTQFYGEFEQVETWWNDELELRLPKRDRKGLKLGK